MSFVPFLLAATVSEALPHLLGFVVVITTLAALLGLCVTVSTIINKFMPAPVAAPRQVSKPRTPVHDGIPEETVLVIAAAVAAVAQKQRIVSIKPQSSSWSQAGRQQIHSSHNIR
jgi:Na+-transporting methylmalonyl-CoA/oxaloacetate decarboxylase gamma subunit